MKVSFGDVVVLDHDYHALDDGEWVTDTVITFCYEYLEETRLKKAVSSGKQRGSGIVLLRASMVHLIAHIQDPQFLESALGGLGLSTAQIVFIPVNDNESADSVGGSHWSLMIYYRPTKSFYYYDSMGRYNLAVAKRTMKRLAPLLSPGSTDTFFVEVDIPSQTNGYDCGVYVIAITEIILDRASSRGSEELADKPGDLSLWRLSHAITPQQIREKRREWQALLDSLQQQ